MADEIIWRYELGCPHDALKAPANNIGRYTNVGWLPKNRLEPDGEEFVS